MSQASHDIESYLSAFWQRVIGNAASITEKIGWLNTQVESIEAKVKHNYTEPIFAKLTLDAAKLKEAVAQNGFYQLVQDSTLPIAALIEKFEAMDINEQASVHAFIAEVNTTIDELLKNSTDTYVQAVKIRTQVTIQAVTDFILYLNQDNPTDLEAHVDTLLHAIADWVGVVARLDEPQQAYVLSLLQRSELVVSLLSHYKNPPEEPLSRHQRIEQFRADLPKAEAEIRKGKLPKQKEVKELHLEEIFDAGMGFTEIQSYEPVQVVAKKIQGIVRSFFAIVRKIYAESNPAAEPYLDFAEDQIVHWFELPEDFRPENWVEVIHYIVQNIQYSFERISDPSFAPVNARVLPILGKLDTILSQVNNDNFKLLITTKESTGIYNIDLPDLLDEDEEEEDEQETERPNVIQVALPQGPANLEDTADDEPYHEPLTYSSVIEFLCFDEELGAMAKMGSEYAEVIRSLYYYNWVGSRLYVLESDLYDFVEQNSLETHWEEISAQLFAEKGLNLGEFVQFLIDKAVSVVNGLINFVKETIQYIIDEVFKLAKAIIAFFLKIDLPLDARKLLKKISLFENMPDEVTLLHVIAAIPYTLYTEFIQFEPQMQAA